jgi:hypothetical protein
MGENSGLLLNFLPKELQSLTRCEEEKVNVHVIYPKNAQAIQPAAIQSFLNFAAGSKDFVSKIHYNFKSI